MGCLSVGYQQAFGWLWSRFDVALGGFARPIRNPQSAIRIRPNVFTISNMNTTPLLRRPRGGLGVPWYHPGHVLYP
jgi:hypothetical protein